MPRVASFGGYTGTNTLWGFGTLREEDPYYGLDYFAQRLPVGMGLYDYIAYFKIMGAGGTRTIGSMWLGERTLNITSGTNGLYPVTTDANSGTLRMILCKVSNNVGTIPAGYQLAFDIYGSYVSGNVNYSFYALLPEISSGTTTFLFGTKGQSNWGDGGAVNLYTTDFATAYFSPTRRAISDTTAVSDTRTKIGHNAFFDYSSVRDLIRFNPRRYVDIMPMTDRIALTSSRQGNIWSYNYNPDYRILFEENGDGVYATTNWHSKELGYSDISKSIRHWSGDFEVGELKPVFADTDNEIYGSLFGSSTSAEPRSKGIQLLLKSANDPLTYRVAYSGIINSIKCMDGKIQFNLTDKMKDIPKRQFVFDYANLGSSGKSGVWGRVKKVLGTEVMFDDFGTTNYIPRKKKGTDIWESIVSALVGGVIAGAGALVTGGWSGVARAVGGGAVFGFTSNLPSSDKYTGGYYKVSDYNAIPDDAVQSGAKIKFYSGSISGQATNLNHPLAKLPEYSVVGGTLRFGIYGTLSFENVKGIKVGDYIYSRVPLVYNGSPNEVIRALLCGSNIDYPYTFGTYYQYNGVQTLPYAEGDFATSWNSDLSSLNLMNLSKIITPDVETSPFEEVKSLVNDCQISFYINEQNKFSAKAIKQRGVFSSGTELHYREGVQILDGFSFEKSTDDAISGLKIFYDYVGNNVGAFKNGYNKLLSEQSPNPINGIENWGTIESRWISTEDDAKVIAYRTIMNRQSGIDKIKLPTTLHGVLHEVSDIIRVSHRTGSLGSRLFEIVDYNKDLDNSVVNLSAIAVDRTYGYGNCLWTADIEGITGTSLSGYSIYGLVGPSTQLGTLVGTLYPTDTSTFIGIPTITDRLPRLCCIGSVLVDSNELIIVTPGVRGFSQNYACDLIRGVGNTVKKMYFTDTPIMIVGTIIDYSTGSYSFDNYILGTIQNIGTNVGSTFRWF